MSLINDMLRDLAEKQSIRQSDETMTIVDTASWEKDRTSGFFQQSRLSLFIYSFLIFVVIFVSSKWLVTQYPSVQLKKYQPLQQANLEIKQNNANEYQSERGHPYEQQAVADKQEASQPPVIDQQQLSATTKLMPGTVNSDHQRRIYQLIDLASRAMTLDRLTSPENDNAYFYYQELLSLDAENPVAIAGMKKMGERYLQMAETAMQKNEVAKAEGFLEKASRMIPNNNLIDDLRKNLAAQNSIQTKENQEDTVLTVESVPVSDPFSTGHSKNNPAIEASVMAVTPNAEFLDQQTVEQARSYIAQGSKTKALDLLQRQIQLYPAPLSEQYLLDIYYQEKNLSAMQHLLNANVHISIVEKTYYQARLAVLETNNTAAIRLLESQLVNAAANENYRALLAGLYQREQLYAQATTAYRNLLQGFTPKPAYWLGLALALDAQDQIPAAAESYRKVLEFEPLEPEVKEYALGRIAQLSREN